MAKRLPTVETNVVRARALAEYEISDPPTVRQLTRFLKDPELDYTPYDSIQTLQREIDALNKEHSSRGCAGCDICTRKAMLSYAKDDLAAAVAIIDSLRENITD